MAGLAAGGRPQRCWLFAYGAGAPEPAQVAAFVASNVPNLQILLAHRPNVSYPTFAAKTFATLDHISDGRLTIHFITGGNDHEQQREGDYFTKDERYDRTREYIGIVKKAWTSREPFDHEGNHYRFADFVSDIFPVQQPRIGVSFGGSSPAAYAAGGAEADIYCLWGEPLADTAEQIANVKAAAKAAGRTDVPRIQVAFRPIIAPTEELAWEKAHRILGRIEARKAAGPLSRRHSLKEPENTGWREVRPRRRVVPPRRPRTARLHTPVQPHVGRRAINAEDALKAAGAEIRTQRTSIGQLLGKSETLNSTSPKTPSSDSSPRTPP